MDPALLGLFVVAGVASLFMAWVVGAGSSGATPFAPAVGANAIPTMRAAFVVGILGFVGAVVQGANVSEAVGRGLVSGVALPATGVIVVLLIGAGLMAVGIRTGYPIATAFTVTGAVVGVGLAVGPLLPLFDEVNAVPVVAILLGGGVGILVGSWTGAPRMIKSLARDYSSLGPRRSIAALVPSFLIAQFAVLLGVPVSFNEIVVSAIIGSGAAVGGRDAVDGRKILFTVAAWVGSFAVAFGLGYVASLALRL